MYTIGSNTTLIPYMLVEKYEVPHDEGVAVSVRFRHDNPPYNIRRAGDDENSTHKFYLIAYMKVVARLWTEMLRCGARRHVLGIMSQFGRWWRMLSQEVMVQEGTAQAPSDPDCKVNKTMIFALKSIPPHHTAAEVFKTVLLQHAARPPPPTSAAEEDIFLWCIMYSQEECLAQFCY